MSEADEQVAVIQYCELLGIPVYHIPNEGKRSVYAGANLKRQGRRKGVPDLCIPVARGKYHSLYIEMKAEGGKLTRDQLDWLNLLRGQGMAAFCCYGSKNAIACIERYMALCDTP